MNSYYGCKNVNWISFELAKQGLGRITTMNDIYCLRVNSKDILIIDFQVTNDTMLSVLDDYKDMIIEINYRARDWLTSKDIAKTKKFERMKTIQSYQNYSNDKVTNYRYILSNAEYKEVEKELNTYLLVNNSNELIETLKEERDLLLNKIKELRKKGDFNSYKNLINIIREVTGLIDKEEERLVFELKQ